ncbi:hypothetical protein QFZ74_000753 [Streptomyces sp. V3I7]|nr:hypothetical protein [Streptomyces sp. V3I7]
MGSRPRADPRGARVRVKTAMVKGGVALRMT